MPYQLAHLNIARMLAPEDSPIMAGFINGLDAMNALAEQSAGFIWRLKGDADNAMAIRVFADPMLIINISVWASIETLYQYAYYSHHADFFRRRHEWFSPMETPSMVLWWIPTGHIPSSAEAKDRLQHLTQHGPTLTAFTFKKPFSPPD